MIKLILDFQNKYVQYFISLNENLLSNRDFVLATYKTLFTMKDFNKAFYKFVVVFNRDDYGRQILHHFIIVGDDYIFDTYYFQFLNDVNVSFNDLSRNNCSNCEAKFLSKLSSEDFDTYNLEILVIDIQEVIIYKISSLMRGIDNRQ
jgi:hypothetical protein